MSDRPLSKPTSPQTEKAGLVRAVVADDHEIVLHGLRDLLHCAGITIAAEVKDGLAAIAAIKREQPELALIDLQLPLANGAEVHAEARRWSPETRFVMLTGSASPNMLAELLGTGLHGLFLKSGPPTELADALPRILAGELVAGNAVTELVDNSDSAGLTRRELQVLQEISSGATGPQISERLGISAKTVENHRASLMRKLQVHSTASLIMTAIRRGLLSPDG